VTDDELLAELAWVATLADPPPELVVVAGRAALATRRLDEELAKLVADSATDDAVLVRGEDSIRLLSFQHGEVSIELQLEQVGGRVTLRGLVSGTTDEITVDTPAEERSGRVDAGGWFAVQDLPPGPLRTRLRAADGTAVSTGWITV
jgi:hypothetical protein